MTTILFYRQERRDGAVRTGIYVDEMRMLDILEPEDAADDPALVWFVDVCCKGRLPTDERRVLSWLRLHEPQICNALLALADKVAAGIDIDSFPIQYRSAKNGIHLEVSCSALRHLQARKIASIIRKVAAQWQANLDKLSARRHVNA